MSFFKNIIGTLSKMSSSSIDPNRDKIVHNYEGITEELTVSREKILTQSPINAKFNVDNFQSYMKFYREKNHLNVFHASKFDAINLVKKQIRHQIVFILDATGSMQSYIDGTKDQIKKFITDVRANVYKDFEKQFLDKKDEFEFVYEIAIIAYRDFSDREQFRTMDFTTNINDVEKFLSIIKADGGKDSQEDVKGAFIHALFGIEPQTPRLNWDDHGDTASRTIFWLADAPPHGTKFNKSKYGDDYPEDDNGWEFLIEEMSKLEIELIIVKLCNSTDYANEVIKNLCDNKVEVEIIDVSQSVLKGFRENSSEVYECLESKTSTKNSTKTFNYVTKIISSGSI